MTDRFAAIATAIPGPRSRALLADLARYETRGVTAISDDYPVVWERGEGALITDVDGNRYIDLTSAFGVAAVGHSNSAVVAAIAEQAGRLTHGMGDVHPPDVKIALLGELARRAPGDCSKTYLGSNGADAIEFARKTALLATGKPGALAFAGGYHGLSLGALPVLGIERFRDPFAALVDDRTTWLPFPGADANLDAALSAIESTLRERADVGALVIEPIQGRGGVIVPPQGYLAGVRALCDAFGVVLVLDEIYTGFGRTGTYWACEREAVVPDILCVGKALGGGVPLSAAIGRPAIVDAWPATDGEALHTATFLGNPLACAAALAVLREIDAHGLVARAHRGEAVLRALLERLLDAPGVREVRGRGMLFAVEFEHAARANAVVRAALARGVILLQSGVSGTSITFAPPLIIDDDQLTSAIDIVVAIAKDLA